MTEVEIFWPAGLPVDAPLDAARTLEAAGLEATCRRQPVRRGGENAALVLVSTSIAGPFLGAVFEHVGDSAYTALRGFVRRLQRSEPQNTAAPPGTVVFESEGGARVVFSPDLPEIAFRQAVSLDQGNGTEWTWNADREQWVSSAD